MSHCGSTYDQRRGWASMPRFAYKGAENIARWKEKASRYDLLLWQIAVPTKQRQNRGNLDWLRLYDLPTSVKQIAHVHDGNLWQGSPHIYEIASRLTGCVAVHPCAYHSLARVPVARALMPSPQADIERRMRQADSIRRGGPIVEPSGFLSLQTFKGWKRVDDLVRAIPYMGDYEKLVAGGGIQYYYMTSETKLKNEYRVSPGRDPDADPRFHGKPIWTHAVDHGMRYLGYISNASREVMLSEANMLIDPSWSKRYAEIGDHFNRVVVDGIIAGACPVARNLGISTNEAGEGELFKAWRNYAMIPWNATPREFAEIVNHVEGMPDERTYIVERAREELLPHFDNRVAAQTLIDLASGREDAGYYDHNKRGLWNTDLALKSEELMTSFFGDRT